MISSRRSIRIPIVDSSQVGDARRRAQLLAGELGLSETDVGKAAIIVSELASNLHKYGREGMIILRPLFSHNSSGMEALALDKGPGMPDVGRCLEDGFSTAGSSGTGLGSIRRLSTVFDIYSSLSSGTAVVAQLWQNETHPNRTAFEIGAVCLPVAGEQYCGDNWCFQEETGKGLIMVADGLGHGSQAALAADTAGQVFEERAGLDLASLLEAIHRRLRSTRGAAAALAEINTMTSKVSFAGVGNIAGSIVMGNIGKGMVSHHGILGAEARHFQEFTYPWTVESLLILHSDGLQSRWALDRYPGLRFCHASLIAGILYRDYERGRDDVTVLAIRQLRHPSNDYTHSHH